MIEKNLEEEEKDESKNLLAEFKKKEKKIKENVKKKLKEFNKKAKEIKKLVKKQEVSSAVAQPPPKTRSKLLWCCLILIILAGLIAILVWVLTRGEVSTNVPTSVPTSSVVTTTPTKIPTKKPTKIPTINPSVAPSTNPTVNPTMLPTLPILSLIFFDAKISSDGNIGDRVATTEHCVTEAVNAGLTCRNAFMFLTYKQSPISDFPNVYSFSALTPLYNKDLVKFGLSWNYTLYTYGLMRSLSEAGVLANDPVEYWTGGIDFVSDQTTCFDWTRSDNTVEFGGYYGSVLEFTRPKWYNYDIQTCDKKRDAVCICTSEQFISDAPTTNPTPTPTKLPSINPTRSPSANPTHNPTNFINSLIIYNAGSTATGNMGNRSVTTATCAAQAIVLALTCQATPMMLSYTTSQVNDFPTIYNFPPTSPLYSVTNVLVASSWNAAMNTAISASLQATGVFPPTTSVYSTGGKTATNTLSNCADWASATSAPSPRTSRGTATATLYPAWFSGSFTRCNVATARMCLCTSTSFI